MRPVAKSRVRVQNKLVDEDHVNDHHVDGDNNDVNVDMSGEQSKSKPGDESEFGGDQPGWTSLA